MEKGDLLKKNKNKLFARIVGLMLCLFVCRSFNVSAQQDPVYTQYMNNLLTIQPAYAGISGNLNFTGLSRAQWVGFDGAPNTNSLTISGPINKYNIALGLSIVNDQWGPLRQNGINIDYAFRVLLSRDQYLSFGLKGEINTFQANFTDLRIFDSPDMVFMYDVKLKFLPNMGVGVMWHGDRFFLGVSIPKMLKKSIMADTGVEAFRDVRHLYVMGGYVFFLSEILKFKPTALFRSASSLPWFIDLSGSFLLYDQVWIGGTSRLTQDNRITAGLIFQYNVNPQLKFGYSYDLTSFYRTQVNSGTHEFMISYDFITVRRGRTTPKFF